MDLALVPSSDAFLTIILAAWSLALRGQPQTTKRSSKHIFHAPQVKYRSQMTPVVPAPANRVRYPGVKVASSTSLDQKLLLTQNLLS